MRLCFHRYLNETAERRPGVAVPRVLAIPAQKGTL